MSDLSISSNKTAGELLKQKRLSLGLDFKSIEKELKIKEKYLGMLEADRFQGFESSVQAKGFLKNYARFLGLNHEMIVALYRRDFENKDMKRKIEFKDEEQPVELQKESKIIEYLKGITITKKRMQIASIFLIFIFLAFIGFNSLRRSFSKPNLSITSPFEINAPYDGKLPFDSDEVVIKGKVDKGSSIKVNSVPINLNANYEFETSSIALNENETSIVFETENTLGSKNQIQLKLYKPEVQVSNLDTLILANQNISYVIIKADGQVFYEGSIANGSEPLNFIGERSIEIETQQFGDLEITINGKIYTLDSPVSIFESNGTEVIIR